MTEARALFDLLLSQAALFPQSFKLAGLSFWPVGRRVVSHELATVARQYAAEEKIKKLADLGWLRREAIPGLPMARKAAVTEAGVDMAIGRHAALGIAYNGQIGQNTQDHSFKGVLAVKF